MKPRSNMTVSVIIPTLNEESSIGELLRSLQSQTFQPSEILVVDGGSTDRTRQIVRSFPKVRWLTGNPPVGTQRNLGGQSAKSELLVFMDADVYPSSDFIEKSVKERREKKIDIACPWTFPYRSTFFIQVIFAFFNVLFWILQWWLPSGGGMCLLIKNSVFKKTRGFRSDLKFEDIEFIRRASRGRKFRILSTQLAVSDRRFRKDGTLITFVKYLLLGILFSAGLFKLANVLPYQFGHYKKS